MDMNSLFETVALVAKCLLPVFGVALLYYIILLVKELISTLKAVEKTLGTTEGQIKKLDAPLATVEDLSKTVDELHHTTKDAAINMASSVKDNVTVIKNWVEEKVSKSSEAKVEEATTSEE